MTTQIYNFLIQSNNTLLAALKLMDTINTKLLIVLEDAKYKGLLSIGDIQRAIINNRDLTSMVYSIMRHDFIVAKPNDSIEDVKKLMLGIRAEFMPVVDNVNNLVKVYTWNELFGDTAKEPLYKFDLPVVIMAGGKGSRLKPLTNIIPKPLIPIHNKTIIEEIMDRFVKHGCSAFFLSVNYKAEMIKQYFEALNNANYTITYFREDQPLGTAGSLALLKGRIDQTFFVSNCDILVDQDYSEVLQYHKNNNNEITIVAAIKTYPIAYGTIETGENGQLLQLFEKPELTFKINSGMYIIEPHLLAEIPENSFFHITQLIENINSRKGKVGVFPVSERSWVDIGEWSLFLKENNISI